MSAAFAIVTDILLLTYRGTIKRRERISARMADVISQLYLASAAIKHFHNQGEREEDLPLLEWSVRDSLYRMQQSLDVLFCNVEPRWLALVLRTVVFPLGRRFAPPPDSLDARAAAVLRRPGDARDRLTTGMYLPSEAGERVADLDETFRRLIAAAPLEAKLNAARRSGALKAGNDLLAEAIQAGILTAEEASVVQEAESARQAAIQVDDFPKLP